MAGSAINGLTALIFSRSDASEKERGPASMAFTFDQIPLESSHWRSSSENLKMLQTKFTIRNDDRRLHFCEGHQPPGALLDLLARECGCYYPEDGKIWLGPWPLEYPPDVEEHQFLNAIWDLIKARWKQIKAATHHLWLLQQEDNSSGCQNCGFCIEGANILQRLGVGSNRYERRPSSRMNLRLCQKLK